MPSDRPPHYVLWTAGWDSTYRVADLVLVHGRRVQPVYVRDPERRSTALELRTMERIRRALDTRGPDVGARLLPTQVIELSEIPPDDRVSAAAAVVGSRTPMGAQYTWLGWLAHSRPDVAFELGWEGPIRFGPIVDATFATGDEAAPDDWMTMPRVGNDVDRLCLFGLFRFPVLGLTKLDMSERAHASGFADIMELTWFCRWPTILGRPCGFCDPCQSTRKAGLERRVPRPTTTRRRLHGARWALVRRGDMLRANARSVTRSIGARHA